jgi:hypothetical protein
MKDAGAFVDLLIDWGRAVYGKEAKGCLLGNFIFIQVVVHHRN